MARKPRKTTTKVQVVEESVVVNEEGDEVVEQVPVEVEVDAVFNSERVAQWVTDGYLRLRGVWDSVLLEKGALPEKHARIILMHLSRSLKPGGVLYVPEEYAAHASLDGMIAEEQVGEYCPLRLR